MNRNVLPDSRVAKALLVVLVVVAAFVLGLMLLVGAACDGDTGFSCGG